jgi:parallel beta-helix repeat protein
MANEIGSGYSSGDYLNSDVYNDAVPAHNKPKTDSPSANKNEVKSAHVNDLGAEIVGLATRMGAGFRGSQETLRERLERSQNEAGDVSGARHTIGFDSLTAALKNNGASVVSGMVVGEPGKTQAMENETCLLGESALHLTMPVDYKLDYKLTTWQTWPAPPGSPGGYNGGFMVFYDKEDIVIEGGEWDGNSAEALDDNVLIEHIHCFAFYRCKRITIKNAYIHDWPGDCLYFDCCDDVLIDGCTIINTNVYGPSPLIGRNGIAVTASLNIALTGSNRIRIVNCSFKYGSPGSVDLEPTGGVITDVVVANNIFVGNDANRAIAAQAGFGGGLTNVVIANNTIRGFLFGMTSEGNYDRFTIIGNIFSECGYGIWMHYLKSCVVENNIIYDNTYGIHVTYDGGTDIFNELRIKGNTIWKSGYWGIYMQGGSGAEAKDVMICNNHFKNNGQTTNVSAINAAYVDDLVIANNVFRDDQTPATQTYPVELNLCDSVVYVGNVCKGHKLSDIGAFTGCTAVQRMMNSEDDVVNFISPTFIDPILKPSAAGQYVTFETDTVGASNDVMYIKNLYPTATKIIILTNLDKVGFYQAGADFVEFQCRILSISPANIQDASVPGNFAANKMVLIKDNLSGNTYYVPAMAATW